MLVKHFRNRAIVGHWYPIVSIDFHDHVMTSMMIFRQGYALVFVSFDARKLFQEMDCLWIFEDGGASETWKVCDCMEGVGWIA